MYQFKINKKSQSNLGKTALPPVTAKNNYGYNGMSHVCLFPFHDHHPHLIHPPWTDPTHYSRRHLDTISHFATVHILDTGTPTDRQTDQQMG